MKAFLISDNHDTLVLMRLAGIAGIVVHGRDETMEAINNVLKNKDIAIIVITEAAAECITDKIQSLHKNESLPLVVEIPDRHGSKRSADYLSRYIREAIGVKVE
ncbi:MAG: V-type ATP synthase subunit F [Synergistaceae bacterium]|nr:V-type ATP synthase subunit F [Synergistaceae bacterium]